MKYVAVLLVLLVGALAYVRFEQPTDWNNYLNICTTALKAPDGASSGSSATTNASNAANASDAAVNDASSPPPAPAPAPSPSPSVPAPATTDEIISPDSTNYINPDHVRPVQQPGEAPAPTNAPATNAPSTNAPATNAADTTGPKVFIPPDPLPARPNWTWTVSGKDYANVVITKVEADFVSITYDLGSGRIDISLLPPDIQKLLNYNPDLAAQAAIERGKEEVASDASLNLAMQQAAINKQSEQAPANAGSTPPTPTKQGLSPVQKASIQDQITSLQADIFFMQGEEAKVYQGGNRQIVKADGNVTTQGAYTAKITEEQAQVTQLEQQLR